MKPLYFKWSYLITALRILAASIFLLPLIWMLTASLRPQGSLTTGPWQVFKPTLANYSKMWTLVPLDNFALNSILIIALAVPLTLLTSSLVGFGISQLPRAGQRRWVIVLLAALMVPETALWSTRFLIYKQLGWLDAPWSLAAPALIGTSPFYILMFYRAFRRVPAGLFEAARLDGGGIIQSWVKVGLPIAQPTAIGVAILSLVVYWGDYISPLLYLRSERWFTLPVALQFLQQLNPTDWPVLMAAGIFTVILPVGLFLVAQPYFQHSQD
jgi:multiple sugar transport system permease protein